MNTIKQFLRSKGYETHVYGTPVADMAALIALIDEYATQVRDEQILLCAVTAACYTAKDVRGVPGRLDDDYANHLIVPKVKISE